MSSNPSRSLKSSLPFYYSFYCFACFSLQNRNNFEKTILHSISLGGDTDTIATMSGGIAGAYYGIEAIPSLWQDTCEGTSDAMEYAEKLYNLSQSMCN